MTSISLILPVVWAFAAPAREPVRRAHTSRRVSPQIALYRRYTEALLRRYLRLSMEVGRAPSLLGRELFRAKVSSYRLVSFEDVVIFLHDVERCLARLDAGQQELIARLALQEYTVLEASALLRRTPSTLVRQYCAALDALTRTLLSVQMLKPIPGSECCQEAESVEEAITPSCRTRCRRKKFGD